MDLELNLDRMELVVEAKIFGYLRHFVLRVKIENF